MRLALSLVLLVGCSSSETTPSVSVSFRFEGAFRGVRSFVESDGQEPGGPRIACIRNGDRVMISAVKNYGQTHGPGLYLRVAHFTGPARYDFAGDDRAWAFDDGHIQLCTRAGDRDCYQGSAGCVVQVDAWTVGPGDGSLPPGVLVGEAWGTFSCASLSNAIAGASVAVQDGAFRCRAEDWTAAGR